jgi:hypothetical protein
MMRHIQIVDIYGNGVGYEVAVMKIDSNGDLYFLRTDHLDSIDYDRLAMILRKREARVLPLWELLSSIKLNNGINALVYFHQFVNVKTASGQIMKPNPRRAGMPARRTLMQTQELVNSRGGQNSKPAATARLTENAATVSTDSHPVIKPKKTRAE